MDSRKVVEVAAAVIFLLLLILAVVIIIGLSGNSSKTTTTITGSYNTYNININNINTASQYSRYPSSYSNYPMYLQTEKTATTSRYLDYNSWSNYERYDGIFGNPIDNYEVYVTNEGYTGGYFKVVYYFEDYYGNTDSYPMTYYIGPQEQQKFVYKDVSPSQYKYNRWWYSVDSMTKVQTKNYYNN